MGAPPPGSSDEGTTRPGAIGELRRVTPAFTFRFDEIPDYDIRLDPDTAGGSLGDLGWYCCRATLWAFDALPTRVFASARMFRGVDMNLSALCGTTTSEWPLLTVGLTSSWGKWFEVAGTAGSLVCDDFLKPWDRDKPRFWIHDRNGLVGEHLAPTPIQEVTMVENFCRAVTSGELRQDWIDDAVATQTMCDALARSAHANRYRVGRLRHRPRLWRPAGCLESPHTRAIIDSATESGVSAGVAQW
ncbi:MAG: hypothetical protein CM1200mP2_35130 [Planctomycetaceae bacterium]|nr:MAG: hypothetical protein CM1200mP2_35130 [Planctomycetaceae bacterium]